MLIQTPEDILAQLTQLVDRSKIKGDNYLISYPHFINYFKHLDTINEENLVIGISFVYSWMPTVLKKLDKKLFTQAITVLNKAKQNHKLTIDDYKLLKQTFNNSIVGTSKLLHFINPDKYAIWDSNIFKFLHNECFQAHHYRIENITMYIDYLQLVNSLTQLDNFDGFYTKVKSMLKENGSISKFRAIELIMFRARSPISLILP